MSTPDLIMESLQRLSEAHEDPAEIIYQRLFARYPELEALFSMDTDGGVRGSMLQQAFECLIDLTEGGTMAHTVIAAERANHDTYDVPTGMFEIFFDIIRDVTKLAVGSDWSPAMEAAWESVLAEAGRLAEETPA